MSVFKIDASGFACPEPVLMVKKAVSDGNDHIEVTVDSVTARENIKRFAKGKDMNVAVDQAGDHFILTITK